MHGTCSNYCCLFFVLDGFYLHVPWLFHTSDDLSIFEEGADLFVKSKRKHTSERYSLTCKFLLYWGRVDGGCGGEVYEQPGLLCRCRTSLCFLTKYSLMSHVYPQNTLQDRSCCFYWQRRLCINEPWMWILNLGLQHHVLCAQLGWTACVQSNVYDRNWDTV